MINNLNDVIRNLNDLLELKKEKLRVLFTDQETLKQEIIELEQAKLKLGSNDVHLIVDNTKVIDTSKTITGNIKSRDILEFIKSNGPVSAKDIREHFNCKSTHIMGLGWLLQTGKIIKDGISEQGKDRFSINDANLKNGTNNE
jgi:hypothetical protein